MSKGLGQRERAVIDYCLNNTGWVRVSDMCEKVKIKWEHGSYMETSGLSAMLRATRSLRDKRYLETGRMANSRYVRLSVSTLSQIHLDKEPVVLDDSDFKCIREKPKTLSEPQLRLAVNYYHNRWARQQSRCFAEDKKLHKLLVKSMEARKALEAYGENN